jgi:hypothetical protein
VISAEVSLAFGHSCMGSADLLRRVGVKLSEIQKNPETEPTVCPSRKSAYWKTSRKKPRAELAAGSKKPRMQDEKHE